MSKKIKEEPTKSFEEHRITKHHLRLGVQGGKDDKGDFVLGVKGGIDNYKDRVVVVNNIPKVLDLVENKNEREVPEEQ